MLCIAVCMPCVISSDEFGLMTSNRICLLGGWELIFNGFLSD